MSAYILVQVAQRKHPNIDVREQPRGVRLHFFCSDA